MIDPIILVGRPHSGTTMLMLIMEQLGVFIGSGDFHRKWKDHNNTEYRSLKVLEDGVKKRLDNAGTGSYIKGEVVKVFGQKDALWGFKGLWMIDSLRKWGKAFPNAKIVHIYRTSNSKHWPLDDWVDKQDKYAQKLSWIPRSQYHKFDYDNALVNKVEEVQTLADFLGVPFTNVQKQWINNFIKEGGVE